jgi:hypothetical protein
LPFPLDRVHPDDVDYRKLEAEISIPISTVKMFIENVSPFRLAEGNKDQFLNGCIEDLYLECESKI